MSISTSRGFLILGALFVLTGCGSANQVGELKDKAPDLQTITEKANQAKNIAANLGPLTDNLKGMKDGVSQTLTAVRAGDFAIAKEEFGQLQTSWQEIEGDIKNVSAESHQTIQAGIDTVATDFESDTPNTEQLTAELENLTGSLGNLAIGGGGDLQASADASDINASDTSAPDNSEIDASGIDASGTNTSDIAENTNTSSNSLQGNLTAMQASLTETQSAIASADMITAKASFSDARQSWFKFGGSVKQTSADTYQAIDDSVKQINQSLSTENPAPEQLLADLGNLSNSLSDVSPAE